VPSVVNVQVPPLPTSSKVPTPSLSSKLAAHFSHSRSSKQTSTTQPSFTPAEPPAASSGLKPPSTRSASFESGSSTGTKKRSTTPRPAQPMITVSLSPDDQFMDLFTRPKRKNLAEPSQSVDKVKKSSAVIDPGITPNASPPASPRTRSSEQSIYRRGYTPASAIAAAVRHQQNSSIGSDRAPSTSSKTSNSRNNSDSDKSNEKDEGSSTPRLSEPRESPRPSLLEKEKGLPPSLQRRPSVATGSNHHSDNGSSTVRSRMRQPSTPARSRPPSMPLPLPPTPNSSPATFPGFQGTQAIKKESASAKAIVRPRAHTIGAVVDLSTPLAPLSQPAANKLIPPTITATSSKADSEILDIENASAEELRKALKFRNLQYDELASFILKMTESHIAEVTALEKKISTLTKDALKREKQIKGFTLLLSDEESSHYPKPLPPGILNQSRFASSMESDPDRNTSQGISRKFSYQSDSGAESHATSGAESLRASGASGSESMTSMIRNKRLRRPYPLGDQAYAASRTGTALRSSRLPPGVGGADKGSSDIPHSNAKRSSISSISGSPSSSTSSLLPPSPSITMSSLSAIPEGPTATLRLPSSDQQEERRALRASHRTSTSSLTSSSTAASSSYSTNIKRSRPPSIAQVLEKTPNMDDVLEKLRPFS